MFKTYETELRVRPDDIDMYNHVHNSRYFDYVMAARYDQMERCYGFSMEMFLERGFGWLVRGVAMDFKRALKMNEYCLVRTSVESIDSKKCRVNFSIVSKASQKVCCDGWFDFVMIDMATGKGIAIPQDVVEHYVASKVCD